MDLYEFIFIIQFLAFIGIFLAKLYNLFSMGQWYDMRIGWILLIGAFLAYGVGFTISMHQQAELGFLSLFQYQIWGLGIHVLLMLAELFVVWYGTATQPIKPYKALEAHGYKTRR